jgi:hypothetical protein
VSDLEDVNEALNEGQLTQSSEIAVGDLAVHQLEASGFEGALNARENEQVTGTFLALNSTSGPINLTISEADPGANQPAQELALDDTDNITVIADGENDTYFIVVDTNDAQFKGGEDLPNDEDTALETNFTVIKNDAGFDFINSDELDDDENSETFVEFTAEEPEASIDESYNVSQAEGQTVSGTTNIAPGTELNLRVRSQSGVSPSFLKTASPEVQSDGTWSATMDFSEQNVGDEYDIVISSSGSLLTSDVSEEGAVVESVGTETVTETETQTEQQREFVDTTFRYGWARDQPLTNTELNIWNAQSEMELVWPMMARMGGLSLATGDWVNADIAGWTVDTDEDQLRITIKDNVYWTQGGEVIDPVTGADWALKDELDWRMTPQESRPDNPTVTGWHESDDDPKVYVRELNHEGYNDQRITGGFWRTPIPTYRNDWYADKLEALKDASTTGGGGTDGCEVDSDCPTGRERDNGTCVAPTCETDADCAGNQVCNIGRCYSRAVDTGSTSGGTTGDDAETVDAGDTTSTEEGDGDGTES